MTFYGLIAIKETYDYIYSFYNFNTDMVQVIGIISHNKIITWLFQLVNNLATDGLAMQGARASAAY